jgi:GT2 family glycosyltransferase
MSSGITIVVPHWNRAQLLERLLTSLAAQSLAPARVLIADNNSTDLSDQVAARFGAGFLPSLSNQGFARAVNRGISAASTPWVAIVNNDTELDPRCLELLLARAEAANAAFAVPRLLQSSNPSLLDGCFDLLARSGCAWRAGHGAPDGPPFHEPREISFAPLTVALFRRDVFSQIGLLDDRFESYLEDVDLGLRCALAGLRGIYVPSALARHLGSATLGAWSPSMVELIARNQVLLAAKHFPASYTWRAIYGQLLWGALALRRGAFLSWYRGKRAGLRLRHAVRASSSPASQSSLDPILKAAEADLRRLQLSSSRDAYWRAYFLVAS